MSFGQGGACPITELVGNRKVGGIEIAYGEVADLSASSFERPNFPGDLEDFGADDAACKRGKAGIADL